MSRKQRIALLAAAVVVAVVAFVVIGTGGDEEEKPAPKADRPDTAAQQADRTTKDDDDAEPPERLPTAIAIRVSEGKPVGGVEEIEVEKGDRVALVVSSRDTRDEVHVHGVDVRQDMEPGKPAELSFEATEDGIFEIELEGSHTQIAELRVTP